MKTQPKNVGVLWKKIQHEWQALDCDIIQYLVETRIYTKTNILENRFTTSNLSRKQIYLVSNTYVYYFIYFYNMNNPFNREFLIKKKKHTNLS